MSERKSCFIFPATEMAIKARIDTLKEEVANLGQSGVFGMDDGDSMDDSEMLSARVGMARLYGEIASMNRLLGVSHVWTVEDVRRNNFDFITLGSEVDAIVNYPDGKKEKLKFSVGSPLDADVRFNPQDPGEHSIISIETPFAQAILGATKGDSRNYKSRDGVVVVDIKNVSKSPFLTS